MSSIERKEPRQEEHNDVTERVEQTIAARSVLSQETVSLETHEVRNAKTLG